MSKVLRVYILNMGILPCVNYTSIKLFSKKKIMTICEDSDTHSRAGSVREEAHPKVRAPRCPSSLPPICSTVATHCWVPQVTAR